MSIQEGPLAEITAHVEQYFEQLTPLQQAQLLRSLAEKYPSGSAAAFEASNIDTGEPVTLEQLEAHIKRLTQSLGPDAERTILHLGQQIARISH